MNLITLKIDFYNYLEQEGKLDEQKAEDLLSSDISIFMYSAEFQKFIDEKGSDYNIPEDFSGSYTDLIEMTFDTETCQFIPNEYTGNKSDENQDIKMLEMLNDLFKQDEVKDAFDIDHDEKISNDEMKNFLQLANQFDNDKENFSLEDIFKTMEGIKDGTFNPAYGIIPKELQGEDAIKLQEQLSEEAAEKVGGDSSKVTSSNNVGGGSSTTPDRKGANDDSKLESGKISDIDKEIERLNNEIISKNNDKAKLKANDKDYQSKVTELNSVLSDISKNEANITNFEQSLHETQTSISSLTAELNNLQDPVLFTEYKDDIENKRKELQAEIEKKNNEAAKLQENIEKEQKALKENKDKQKELEGIIESYEKNEPNSEIDKINQEITALKEQITKLENDKKEKKENDLSKVRNREISDAKVYGEAKAYRESNEFTRWMMDYATSKETRNRYDNTNFGGAWCAIFTSEVTEKLYAEVAKRLGISTNKSQGMNGNQVAMHAVAWGNLYQKDFDAIGLKQKAAINVTNMTEQQRKDAVRNGLIYPGMTFEYEANGGYHTGFIESINEDLTWNTIEGNSTGGKTGVNVRDASNQRLSSATDTTLKCMYWLVRSGKITAAEANKRLYNAA